MKHPSIRELFDYWSERRGNRAAPERDDIDPGAIRRVLADTFILAFDPRAGHPFRIAGTRVCAAFGRELKGKAFVDLWSVGCRRPIRHILDLVAHEAISVVAGARGVSSAGSELDFEFLALPLSDCGRTDVRILGALAPAEVPPWFGTSMLQSLTLGILRYLEPNTTTAPAPLTVAPMPNGRLRRGLVVYDGGQAWVKPRREPT